MKLAAKIKKFEKAGATVAECKFISGLYYATFKNGKVVEFCENFQAVICGYDDASQETLRSFQSSVSKAIARAIA